MPEGWLSAGYKMKTTQPNLRLVFQSPLRIQIYDLLIDNYIYIIYKVLIRNEKLFCKGLKTSINLLLNLQISIYGSKYSFQQINSIKT